MSAAKSASDIYIGLMSGTSIDSIDVVAARFTEHPIELLASLSYPIPEKVRSNILTLCSPGGDSVQLLAETDLQMGRLFAEAACTLMASLSLDISQITAIGSHGQTVRHSPPETGSAFTVQIGDPNIIAVHSGCPVVADFRRKDMALGGQGAPLVPAFHHQLFSHDHLNRVIVNIGGMANITVLPASGVCYGYDTGPGNVLLDAWILKHLNKSYDENGQWCASGQVCTPLLLQLKAHPFFSQTAPKSTGREAFNLSWLEQELIGHSLPAEDVQATLLALTAESISDEILGLTPKTDEIYLCGGGAFNPVLVSQLESLLHPAIVSSTKVLGLDPCWVEAAAFAWLAKQRMEQLPGNLPEVTGASSKTVLGGLYLP